MRRSIIEWFIADVLAMFAARATGNPGWAMAILYTGENVVGCIKVAQFLALVVGLVALFFSWKYAALAFGLYALIDLITSKFE